MLDFPHILVITATILVVFSAVFLHYEAFVRISGALARSGRRGRPAVLLVVVSLLFLHIVEIWMFAGVAWALTTVNGTGGVVAEHAMGFFDYVYLSATTFTTLGYGDLVPTGAIRFLYGTESLAGFALLTWSASLTFIEMQRSWGFSEAR